MRLRNRWFVLWVLALLLVFSTRSRATHIFGGELLYNHIAADTYKITLTMYGDCGSPAEETFLSLYTAIPNILIYDGSTFYDSLKLWHDTVGIEVSPVCPRQMLQTTCHNGTLPGVRKFIYTGIIRLNHTSDKWRFFFTGQMGDASGAGRSNNISNIFDPGNSIMQIEATLNNSVTPNSSPRYSTTPTPFYCLGIDQQYNHGAVDADGDSLVFSMVPAMEATNPYGPLVNGTANYVFPFSYDFPVNASTFSFNAVNGQISFNPSSVQEALVVCKVSEYRAGILVGTSEREMTFIVANNCNGTPPTVNVHNLYGGTLTDGNIINVCQGTHLLHFDYQFTNPDLDSTELTYTSVPSSSVLDISANNTPAPSASFSWNMDTIPLGHYTFYLTVKNNHCPISNTQTIAYTINVVERPVFSFQQLTPTECVHQALVEFTMDKGYLPRNVSITQGTHIVTSFSDNSGFRSDSLPAGDYTVVVASDSGCFVSTVISIKDSGTLPLYSVISSFCLGDSAQVINVPIPGEPTTVIWYDDANNQLPGAPLPNTDVAGTSTWSVVEHYKVCTSAVTPMKAIVHPLPHITMTGYKPEFCLGDSVHLTATGGVTYTWSSPDSGRVTLRDRGDGELFFIIMEPVRIQVIVKDENNCVDTAMNLFGNIQPCCEFYYPTAFSPNKDGLNDGFKVGTYGNMMNYRLAIYDRWGQIMFLSFDPMARWDGRHNGYDCEIGTYFYYFRGMCLTGRMEEYKGEVTLVR